MRRLLKLGLAVWLLRWAAIELASYAGRHWRKRGPAPIDFPRVSGGPAPVQTEPVSVSEQGDETATTP